jgi:hypothetical protein
MWKTESQSSKIKYKLKRKAEEILVKQHKSCERDMQELSDSIKTPNLRNMGMEEEQVGKPNEYLIYSIK